MSDAIITVSHIATLNEIIGCLKLLAAKIIAVTHKAIEMYSIAL